MVARRKNISCPVEAYARNVLDGRIVAGRLVRLACERHVRDLQYGPKRGLSFSGKDRDSVLDFFGFLKLPEGEKPFDLVGWQKFIAGSLFGWLGPDGYRRFRTAYIEAGKGSGKSPFVAGIGLKGLDADNELDPEIYAAAVTRDQASVVFRDAKRMAEASAHLSRRLTIDKYNISGRDGFFRAVSSEHRGLDGKRVHMAIVDELHEHPTSLVVDKMRANTKGRNQALILEITNSGHDRTTVCWQHREYSEKILTGVLEDDSWFAYVCGLDACEKCIAEGKTMPSDSCPECDDWRDEKVWLKACPNLDVSVTRKYLREQVREAEGMPSKENIVKRLNFCIWTEHVNSAIPMDSWDACGAPIDLASLAGRQCFGGLDIGATSDFTAFDLIFPHDDIEQTEILIDPENPDGGKRIFNRRSYTLLSWFWLPEIPVNRDKSMETVIATWKRQDFIRTTPGNVVDYDMVLDDILAIVKPFSLAGIGFDRGYQGSQMGNNLMKHYGDMVEQVPQGILTMNAPFREFLELLKLRRIHHSGDPVLRWMASNTVAETRGGLIKPSKDHSKEKIDGIAAGTMALYLAMNANVDPPSIYSTPGNLAL